MNIPENINQFINGKGKNKGRNADARYASFDYCFKYFQSFKDNNCVTEISNENNIQLSCLHLGFYLASWGMLRGSSFLLETSVRYLMQIIEKISKFDRNMWDIDVNNYSREHIDLLIKCKNMIIDSLGKDNNPTDTLVSKIMLGVFGNVPAFDDNFCKGFQLKKIINEQTLFRISDFYNSNKSLIDNYDIYTFDFYSGHETKRKYTKAKLIDMIGFIEGVNKK